MIKRKDILLTGGILVIALAFWLVYTFGNFGKGAYLKITQDGRTIGEYPLSKDQVIPIGDTNVCQIKDQKVTMTEANCPDHLCMKQKSIDSRGGTIVCLPNKIVLEIENTTSSDSEIDAVT